jgi:hypothetical protein
MRPLLVTVRVHLLATVAVRLPAQASFRTY